MQLLSLASKLDDLYDLLTMDGINGTEYFARAGLRCRRQHGEQVLSSLPEESEGDSVFVNVPDVGPERQLFATAVTMTTMTTSTYEPQESQMTEVKELSNAESIPNGHAMSNDDLLTSSSPDSHNNVDEGGHERRLLEF